MFDLVTKKSNVLKVMTTFLFIMTGMARVVFLMLGFGL